MFDAVYAVLDRATVFDGVRRVTYARVRGGRVLEFGECPVDQLAQLGAIHLRASLSSPMNFARRVSLDAFRRSLVPFVARAYLEQEGAFSERFRLRTDILSLREGKAQACLVACAEEDAELAMDSLPVLRRPLTRLALAESAIAALVGRATREPVLVVWYRRGVLTLLQVASSRVLWQSSQRVDPSDFIAGSSAWPAIVERAVAGAPLVGHAGDHGYRLNLGDGPWRANDGWAINGSRELAQRVGSLFKGVEPDTVLAHPELFGLAFVPQAANLVMNGYGQKVRAWLWGLPVSAAAICCGLALGVGGVIANAQGQRQEAGQVIEVAELASRHSQVKASLPQPEAVTELQKALAMNDVLTGSVRVDHLLGRIVELTPPEVRLRRFEVGRVKQERGQPAKSSAQGGPRFFAQVNFELAGTFASSRARADVLVERLASLGALEGTRFNHEDEQAKSGTPKASLSTRILLDPKALP